MVCELRDAFDGGRKGGRTTYVVGHSSGGGLMELSDCEHVESSRLWAGDHIRYIWAVYLGGRVVDRWCPTCGAVRCYDSFEPSTYWSRPWMNTPKVGDHSRVQGCGWHPHFLEHDWVELASESGVHFRGDVVAAWCRGCGHLRCKTGEILAVTGYVEPRTFWDVLLEDSDV